MNIEKKLLAALSPIALTRAVIYDSPPQEYIVFNYNSIPSDFGDDTAAHDRLLIQVHYFSPSNTDIPGKRKAIKNALVSADTTPPSFTDLSDKDGIHLVFECETAQGAEVD